MKEAPRTGTDLLARMSYIGINGKQMCTMCGLAMQTYSSYIYCYGADRAATKGSPIRMWRIVDKLTKQHDAEVDRVLKIALDDYEAYNGRPPELVRLAWMNKQDIHPDGLPYSFHNAVMRDAAYEIEQEGIPVRFVRWTQLRDGDIK